MISGCIRKMSGRYVFRITEGIHSEYNSGFCTICKIQRVGSSWELRLICEDKDGDKICSYFCDCIELDPEIWKAYVVG